jgi:hypothetical protein
LNPSFACDKAADHTFRFAPLFGQIRYGEACT